MRVSREDRSRGGRSAQDKVYYCEKCGGIGQGSQMINYHLKKDCEGIQGRKLIKATERNSHRLEEAIVNTAEWQAEQAIKDARAIMNEQKSRALASLEELRKVNNQVMSEAYETYYSKIF